MAKALPRFAVVYLVCLGVWFSGAFWLLLHYFFAQQTEFGPARHPWEYGTLVAHGAFAFAALWMVGFLWGTHVVDRWRRHRHRKTGGMLFSILLLLIVTGFFLYYEPGEDWRSTTAQVHWLVGLGMPVGLLGHWLIRDR